MILKFGNETEISSFIISSHSSHISPSNIESTLQSKKFARKYHSKTLQRSIEYSIVLSAAEPTTLPFLGSKEVPFDNKNWDTLALLASVSHFLFSYHSVKCPQTNIGFKLIGCPINDKSRFFITADRPLILVSHF